MKCPKCGYSGKNPLSQAAGRLGGLAHVPSKGFGSPAVLRKAQATRKRNRMMMKQGKGEQNPNAGNKEQGTP